MPPVAISSTSGNGPRSSRTCAELRLDAGKSFTNVAPRSHAWALRRRVGARDDRQSAFQRTVHDG